MANSKARTTTAIRFPDEVHQRLKEAAEERDLSINFMVVKAVEEMLDNLLPASELRLTRSA
jgi:predicted transcriptional regulator